MVVVSGGGKRAKFTKFVRKFSATVAPLRALTFQALLFISASQHGEPNVKPKTQRLNQELETETLLLLCLPVWNYYVGLFQRILRYQPTVLPDPESGRNILSVADNGSQKDPSLLFTHLQEGSKGTIETESCWHWFSIPLPMVPLTSPHNCNSCRHKA